MKQRFVLSVVLLLVVFYSKAQQDVQFSQYVFNGLTVNPAYAGYKDLKIPNVITPDGNGKNDYFQILGLERYPGSELVIVNRWGHEVYRSKSYDNKWKADGLSSGVYYYILQVRQPDGKMAPYKGWIEVIKK